MKGLLRKDLYMAAKYCRAYLLLGAFFLAISAWSDQNLFFLFYPCMLCGLIPVNLLGYDEKFGWPVYSETLPCTRAQMVSSKYLLGAAAQAVMLALTVAVQAVRTAVDGSFRAVDCLTLALILLAMSLTTSSIILPFLFKLGVEKGRLVYLIAVGMVSAGSVIASSFFSLGRQNIVITGAVLPLLCAVSIGMYALSWYCSIIFYRRREL